MRFSWTVESGARWLDGGNPPADATPAEPGVGYEEDGGGIRSIESGGGGGGAVCVRSSRAYMTLITFWKKVKVEEVVAG